MILGLAYFSMSTTASIILAASGLLALFTFYGWLAWRSNAHAILSAQPFGMPDALCAGILALWMISVISHGFDAPQTISLEAILANSILYGTLILAIFGVIGLQKKSAIAIFALQPSLFLRAATTGLLWLVISYPLILATQAAVQQFSGRVDDSQLIVRYFLEHPDWKHRAAVILMAVVVAPIAEEVIFRGYFYGVIRRYGGRIPALLISSLLFAAIHIHLPSVPGLFLLAIILCLLYERTGSLWAPIALHAAFNASTIVCLIFWPEMAS
jgi:membrane protease YdiL (CAAX protease family)